MSALNKDTLDALKVDDLKKELTARGAKVTSTMKKGDLVASLRALLIEEEAKAAAANAAAQAAAQEEDDVDEGEEGDFEGEEGDDGQGEGEEGDEELEDAPQTQAPGGPALTAEEKKSLRAQRFGLPINEAALGNRDAKQARKERFGIVDPSEKKEARKERFGIVTPDDVKKKREERFGKVEKPSNPSPKHGGFKKQRQGHFDTTKKFNGNRQGGNFQKNRQGGNNNGNKNGGGFKKRRFSNEGNKGGNKGGKRFDFEGSSGEQKQSRLARFQ